MRPVQLGRMQYVADLTLRGIPCFIQATLLSGALILSALDAQAQSFDATDVPDPAEVSNAPSLELSFDLFDTRADVGRPLWMRLPQVPFLREEREVEPAPTLALDPNPIGPSQTLRPVQQARSLFDPEPMGPLERLQGQQPTIAMTPPQDIASPETIVPYPEETGSVVILRRRY